MATITLKIDEDKVVCAFFRKKKFNLETFVDPIGSGTITNSGVFDKGAYVVVEAIPSVDYEFDHFTVNENEEPADPEG